MERIKWFHILSNVKVSINVLKSKLHFKYNPNGEGKLYSTCYERKGISTIVLEATVKTEKKKVRG